MHIPATASYCCSIKYTLVSHACYYSSSVILPGAYWYLGSYTFCASVRSAVSYRVVFMQYRVARDQLK